MNNKIKLINLILVIVIFAVACGGDPGESYVKSGNYNKALAVYNEKISDEYASSDLVKLHCYKAVAYAKVPNARAAWGTWKVARAINYKIRNDNKEKKELNKLLASAAREIKKTLAIASSRSSAQRSAAFEKQKPDIYKRARKLEARGANLAALRKYSAISDYADSARRIKRLRAKLNIKVNSLWQQGFALYSAESYSRAIRVFDQILAINPRHNNARIYKQKAKSKLKALKKF